LTYRKPDEHQRCQFSWTRGGRSFRGHQCRRGPQWCAATQLASTPKRMRGHSYADNTLGADQLDQLVLNASLAVALTVRLEVAEVTDMAFLVLGCTVCRVLGVDCPLLATFLIPSLAYSLQWGPADVHPLVLSPKACTCMPRSALASLPVMSHEMVVLALSSACSKVTVPLTLESPRRTATGEH
jgi:hypothetical protein